MFKFVMTKNSNELFHRAILQNDIQRTKLILEEAMKDPRFKIDEINEEGLTALQFSSFAGNLEIIKILVSYKANYKIRDRDGYTLLHAAAMSGNTEVLSYLIYIGLKPVVRTDNGLMPIDMTEEITIIVILLRAMLDAGYLQEMQEYMMDHPKLKRNIFQELELMKCKEKEKNEILRDLPYTSHTTRRQPKRVEMLKKDFSRSLSTFNALSDSIQNLDCVGLKDPLEEENRNTLLRRQNSFSSTSSKGSKSSHGSGILRHDRSHSNTQQYLESRFPQSAKSVSFDLDHNPARFASEEYASSDGYEEHNRVATVSRSSSSSSMSSRSDYHESMQRLFEEPVYENVAKTLTTINENAATKLLPPPIPPRGIPTNFESNISTRSSETDSGIDINETNDRMFALATDDRRRETFSKPIGLFYSRDQQAAMVKQRSNTDENLPYGYFIRPNTKKYQSWNGRMLDLHLNDTNEANSRGFNRLAEFNRQHGHYNNSDDEVGNYTKKDTVRALSTGNLYTEKYSSRNEHVEYNFDHQPDIML